MLYGDQRQIEEAHSLALRHAIAAIRHLAAPDGYVSDKRAAIRHCDEAIAAVERAERAARNTGDAEPAVVIDDPSLEQREASMKRTTHVGQSLVEAGIFILCILVGVGVLIYLTR